MPPPDASDVVALTGSSVVTPAGDGAATIRIERGRIVEVSRGTARPGGTQEIVAPGFVDLQVNGVDDIDFWAAEGEDWGRAAELLTPSGTTAWLPTLVSQPLDRYARPLADVGAAMEAQSESDRAPMVLGVHLEGPFLGGRPGAHRRDAIVPVDLAWLSVLPPAVRLVTLAPEQPEALDAVRLLRDRGIAVSLGHSGADFDTAQAAIDAGATMVTHLFNGMGALHHREPGIAGAALADDRVIAGVIADLVHVHPALLRTAFRAKGPDRIALVTDAVAWRAGRLGAAGITVTDGAPRLPDGTLAGSSLTMDAAVRNVVDAAAVPVADALRAASSTPAHVLGDRSRGRIEVGARADFVVLGASDLRVRRTIVGGCTVWEA